MHFENSREQRLKDYDNDSDLYLEGQSFRDYFDYCSDYKIPSYVENQKSKKTEENKRMNEKS